LPDTCSRSKASIEEFKSRNVTGAAVLIAKIKAISRTKKGDLRTGQRKSIRQKSPSQVKTSVGVRRFQVSYVCSCGYTTPDPPIRARMRMRAPPEIGMTYPDTGHEC
jgi:hypothetical protein